MNTIKNKKKIVLGTIIVAIILLISLISLGYSSYKLYIWKRDTDSAKKQINEINMTTVINEVADDNETIVIEQKEIKKQDPYYDYIKMNLINVDFSNLKNKNNQTKGWIYVGGTNINYPFVQADDNEYYLNHSFDKSYNTAGWVFMDYRNNINSLDKNTILYAHSVKNKTMFSSLVNILNSNWKNNKDNYIVKLSTENMNTLWQVFSVYKIPTTSDYIDNEFTSDEEFYEWAQMLLKRSKFDFKTNVSKDDFVLTLSTCYNTKEKTVLHAKLIKKEVR